MPITPMPIRLTQEDHKFGYKTLWTTKRIQVQGEPGLYIYIKPVSETKNKIKPKFKE